MDAVLLARIQFAFTIAFHYIFPPLSIGLGVILVAMEGIYLKTKNPLYEQMTKFWVKIFGLIFAIGVASGIVMEFQFGTNWSRYSRFVGDIFGSALAAEGIFAFFLESGFLAILLFGWKRVSKEMHFISTILVCLGAHFSAVWIVIANSWQQTPVGFQLIGEGVMRRAEITDFWAVVFNPSSMERLSHVIMGAWSAAAFFVLSVSAYYLLKKRHLDFARASIKIALVLACIATILQLATGHISAIGVAEHQPAKLAAFEGHYPESAAGDLYLFGWVDEENGKTYGLKLPGMLSMLVHGTAKKALTGLNAFKPEDRPPVNIVFQSYHIMIAIGMLLMAIAFGALFFWWRGVLFEKRWLLWVFVFSVLGPQIANQLGWMSAEVGRQPWIVYNLLRTSEAASPVVGAGSILWSLIMFGLIYGLLFVLFIFLLDRKIRGGPQAVDSKPTQTQRA